MNAALTLAAILLTAISGVPSLFMARDSRVGERVAAVLVAAGSACGLVVAFRVGLSPRAELVALPWRVPGGELALRLDAISAMFLAQILVIAPLASVYGLEYWAQGDHPTNGRKLRVFHGLLTASMVILVVAHNAILFLVGWEGMALAAFFVVTTDDTDEAVQKSGFIYLCATRVGTLSLFAMFAVMHAATGAWAFDLSGPVAPPFATALFLLGLFGCTIKGGVMPMHVWLPGAHANAPSHVSAYMSGVLIKMGIYGLVRLCSFFDHPPLWWGVLILSLGIVSGVLGVAFAIAQHDLKRLLAYHSVENIGIIVMGLGLAVVGRAIGRPDLVVVGLAGALLHVWNHGLFKALLFFGAGSVIHALHTREIDAMGGLAKKMPRAAVGFLVGAIAICGLPPLNGFVSELFVYLGFFRTVLSDVRGVWVAGAFGAPALALVGALALACFVKVFGAVFLGAPRTERGEHAHDPGPFMVAPMAILGVLCALIGLVPAAVAPILDNAIAAWAPESARIAPSIGALAPLVALSATGVALLVVAGVVGIFFARAGQPSRAAAAVTWDCGYVAPSARMQYTASSFAGVLVGLFSWALRPVVHDVALQSTFPGPARFEAHVHDTVLERAVLPASRGVGRLLVWFRWVQRGSVQLYIVYVLAALLLTLLVRR